MPRPLTYHDLTEFFTALVARDSRAGFVVVVDTDGTESISESVGTQVIHQRDRLRIEGLSGLAQVFGRCEHDDSPESLERVTWSSGPDRVTLRVASRKVEIATGRLEFAELCQQHLRGLRIRKFIVELTMP